ncbi:MAG: argininosuccinate synthase, partial [Pseudonocardiaceae bacterium]
HEGGELEDAGNAPLETTWVWTRSPQDAPDRTETVEIGFERGTPVSVNGMRLDPVQLLELLNEIAARNAIGRIDLVENRFVGMKSRGCYETPGGSILLAAIREIEALTLDRSTLHYKQKTALDYAELVYNGLWFTPLRESLEAFFAKAAEPVSGEVTLRLCRGLIDPLSRKSRNSLYNLDIASFTMGASYDQKDAFGFINLIGLPIKVRASLHPDAP